MIPAGHYWEPIGNRHQTDSRSHTRKVAIIGAGPSGSSAAYYLRRAQDRLAFTASASHERIDITIYERNKRIGGRAAVVYPHDDETYEPVELGASIYADVNYNLRRAVKEFGLDTGAQNGESGEMGVWDGQQFLFIGDASSWWTSAKFFLRYGYSALTAQNLVAKQLSLFSHLYNPSFLHKPSNTRFPWSTVEQLAEAVNVSSLAAMTGLDYFKDHRVSDLFIEEMIEAATRVNYAQDTDQIHGFGALVSLAATGATGVKDGNYRIFEEFVQRSGATLLTGIEGEVTGIVRFDRIQRPSSIKEQGDQGPQWYIGTKSGEGETYDAVIIATPWHNADITLLNTESRVKAKPFVHLHVTLLTTTTSGPDPRYFGLGIQDSVPKTILTSDESIRRAVREKNNRTQTCDGVDCQADAKRGASKKQPKMDFFSLNYLRPLRPRESKLTADDSAKEYVVKIFSHEVMTDDLLDRLFGLSTITWVKRHEWDSYPLLTPTTRFPHIQVDDNLYYPNAMESLVSTMETSTVSARNAVGLLLRKWYGNDFVNGQDCKYSAAESAQDPMKNADWAGWGCESG